MRFDSEAQRLTHPQARLIPKIVWELEFEDGLSDAALVLMQPNSLQNLAHASETFLRMPENYRRRQAAIALLYAHPDASVTLIENATAFNVSPDDLLFIAVSAERHDMIQAITATFPEIIHRLTKAVNLASRLGYLPVIEQLMALAPRSVTERFMEMVPRSVMNQLMMPRAPDEVLAMIKAGAYSAFYTAASRGHLHIMERFMEIAPDDVMAMIKANEYSAFRFAASSGHLDVMERLVELAPGDVQAMIQGDNYYAFRYAASNGHLHVMERLMELAPSDVQAMIQADDYFAFREAALNGHLHVMERLMVLTPDEVPAMIQAENYEAFRSAASFGHLHVMERLMELAPSDVQAMIQAENYEAFRHVAFSGHLPVMERLMELAPSDVPSMIQAENYNAFRYAVSSGHLHVMERLMELAPSDVQAMIQADDYGAFRYAASSGHLHVMERLMELAPSDVQAMIQERNYFAFRHVAFSGHLPVMERLMELAPSDVQAMIQADDYSTFRYAASSGHLPVINRLLLFPIVLAYAEQHEQEYGAYTHPFITQQLNLFRTQQATFETEQTQAVFNVDADKAQLCFYMLRNLIRRNDATLQDEIRFLLNILAIKALAHISISGGQSNELIRLALTIGNQHAADILLMIPAVRSLAEQNNFYRNEVRGDFDLQAIARDHESSMRSLSTGEQLRLSSALARYEPMMRAQGVDALFKGFREQLKARYSAHPAHIQTSDGRGVELPLAWTPWQTLSKELSADIRKQALQAYYQHKDHTALRYLSKPNPWMATNAAYVNRAGRQSWSTFDEYKPLITMLWLAAKDTSSDITVAPTDGYRVETRMDRFIDEIALLGRAHNWDEQHNKMDAQGNLLMDESGNPILEEYDDLQGDKPSCYSGVKRRLFQSVLGHPLLKILTLDDIKQELRDFVRDYFKQHITNSNRDAIRTAWESLCETGIYDATQHDSLNQLNISPEMQTAFIHHLAEKYPTQFDQDPTFKTYIQQRFTLSHIFPTHAIGFGGETSLDGLLTLPAATDISAQSILKAKIRLNPLGELGQAVIAEIQCLQHGCNSFSLPAWTGSEEKLASILAAVNTLVDVSTDSLAQDLINERSVLSQAVFKSLSTPTNGNQTPDAQHMQSIQDVLAGVQAKATFR